MSTVIIGGGGPRPQARIVAVRELGENGQLADETSFEVRDGDSVLLRCTKLSHAKALLPLIQSGE